MRLSLSLFLRFSIFFARQVITFNVNFWLRKKDPARTNGLHECGRLRALTDTCARKERACAHECVRARQTMQNSIFIAENGLAFQPEIWDQFWARKLSYANLASQDIHVRAPRPF